MKPREFWGVWKIGIEWPMLHATEKSARESADRLARDNVGCTVHVMRIVSAGTLIYPAIPELTGILAETP